MNDEKILRKTLTDVAINSPCRDVKLKKGWVMDICRARDFDGNEHIGYLTNDGEGGLEIHEDVGNSIAVTAIDKSTVEFVARAEYCIDWRPRARYQQGI